MAVQFCYRKPGARLCGIATRPDSQDVEPIHLRSSEKRVSLRLLPNYCVIAFILCLLNLSVIRNLRVSARHNILQWLTIKTAFCTQFMDTFIFGPHKKFSIPGCKQYILTLILRRSRTGTVWSYTSTSNKRAARPKLYTKSLTRDLKLMYSRLTLVRISINL